MRLLAAWKLDRAPIENRLCLGGEGVQIRSGPIRRKYWNTWRRILITPCDTPSETALVEVPRHAGIDELYAGHRENSYFRQMVSGDLYRGRCAA